MSRFVCLVLAVVFFGCNVSAAPCAHYDFYFSKKAKAEQDMWLAQWKEKKKAGRESLYRFERKVEDREYFFMIPTGKPAKREGFEDLEKVAENVCETRATIHRLMDYAGSPELKKPPLLLSEISPKPFTAKLAAKPPPKPKRKDHKHK